MGESYSQSPFQNNRVYLSKVMNSEPHSKKLGLTKGKCPSRRKVRRKALKLRRTPEKIQVSSDCPVEGDDSVDQVLGNPKLLTDIFHYLDLHDKKSCRLVNQMWNILTSCVMQADQSIQISLLYSESSGCFHQKLWDEKEKEASLNTDCDLQKTKKSLVDLIDCMKLSKNFPCQNFRFESGDLRLSQVQNFFYLFGPQIKGLDLAFGRCYCHHGDHKWSLVDTLSNILLNQVVNLEYLTLSFVWYSPCLRESKVLFPNFVQLPQLRSLNIGHWFPSSQWGIVSDILNAAPKLQEFFSDGLKRDFHLDNFCSSS